MKTKIASSIMMVCLVGSLLAVSGCSEIEPVAMNCVDEQENPLSTRANAAGWAFSGPDNTTVGTWETYSLTHPIVTRQVMISWDVTPNSFMEEFVPTDDGSNGEEMKYKYKFNTPGTYTFTVTAKSVGNPIPAIASFTKTVNVLPPSPPSIRSTHNWYPSDPYGEFYVWDPQPGVTYEWDSNRINWLWRLGVGDVAQLYPETTNLGEFEVWAQARAKVISGGFTTYSTWSSPGYIMCYFNDPYYRAAATEGKKDTSEE